MKLFNQKLVRKKLRKRNYGIKTINLLFKDLKIFKRKELLEDPNSRLSKFKARYKVKTKRVKK